MAGTITGAAVINIQTAAAIAGIASDRIIEALESPLFTTAWNDGGLSGSAAELKSALVAVLLGVGIEENKAELFCDEIIILDTGLTATGTIPTITALTHTAAEKVLKDAGFTLGATAAATNRGDFLIGLVGSQVPTTGTDALGTPVTMTIQLGQEIPVNEDLTLQVVITALDALGLVLTGVGADLTGTAEADDEKVTISSHGLSNDDRVLLHVGTGGTGWTVGDIYWVIGVSGDDFQLSLSEGGAAVAISVDYSVITLRKLTLTYVVLIDDEALEDVAVSSPVALTKVEYGSAVVISPVGGSVPDWTTGGSGDGGVLDNTEMETAIAAAGVGLVGDGTEQSDASTNGTVLALTSLTIADVLPPGQKVEYTYSGT